jgi:hypothetical protein
LFPAVTQPINTREGKMTTKVTNVISSLPAIDPRANVPQICCYRRIALMSSLLDGLITREEFDAEANNGFKLPYMTLSLNNVS